MCASSVCVTFFCCFFYSFLCFQEPLQLIRISLGAIWRILICNFRCLFTAGLLFSRSFSDLRQPFPLIKRDSKGGTWLLHTAIRERAKKPVTEASAKNRLTRRLVIQTPLYMKSYPITKWPNSCRDWKVTEANCPHKRRELKTFKNLKPIVTIQP